MSKELLNVATNLYTYRGGNNFIFFNLYLFFVLLVIFIRALRGFNIKQCREHAASRYTYAGR